MERFLQVTRVSEQGTRAHVRTQQQCLVASGWRQSVHGFSAETFPARASSRRYFFFLTFLLVHTRPFESREIPQNKLTPAGTLHLGIGPVVSPGDQT